MDFFTSLFGGLFDLNHDGKTDAAESFMAYSLLNDTLNEDADAEDEESLFADAAEDEDYGFSGFDFDDD